MRTLSALAALAATLAVAGCAMPHSGERGGFEAYAVRFTVTDKATGAPLADVAVQVKAGLRSVVGTGATNPGGEYFFQKEYGRTSAWGITDRDGYPSHFVVTFSREGYKTLVLAMAEDAFRFGRMADMSVARKAVSLEKGSGEVRIDERQAGKK